MAAAADTRLTAALRQPGAVQRDGYVKFACPGCVAEGHDRHQDNAAFFVDAGTWGCAYAKDTPQGREHWQAIGRALGALDDFADDGSDQPALDAGDLNLPRITAAAWKALVAANDPPRLFRYGGQLVRLVKDEEPPHEA